MLRTTAVARGWAHEIPGSDHPAEPREEWSTADEIRAIVARTRPADLAELDAARERERADTDVTIEMITARSERYAKRLISLAKEADSTAYEAVADRSLQHGADEYRTRQVENKRREEAARTGREQRLRAAAGTDYEWILTFAAVALFLWGVGTAFVGGETTSGRLAISVLLIVAAVWLFRWGQQHSRERAARIKEAEEVLAVQSTDASRDPR